MKFILTLVLALSQTAVAAEQKITEAFDALSALETKELLSPTTTVTIEPGRLEADSQSVISIQDVQLVNNNAVAFTIKSVKTQTNYLLTQTGERILPGEQVDSTDEIRHVFTLRRSTGKILGIGYPLVGETGYEVAGDLTVEGSKVTLSLRSATDHVDAYSANANGRKPAVFKTTREFGVIDGKVYLKNTETGFDIDLTTGALSQYAEIVREFRERP